MEGIGIGKGRNQVPTLFHRYRTILQLIACANIGNNNWQHGGITTMTPLQKLELRMSDLRKELAAAP